MDNTQLFLAALQGLEAQRQRIEEQIAHIQAALGGRAGRHVGPANGRRKIRKLSAAARKRIADAQKKRWAEYKKKAKAKTKTATAEG